MLYTLDSTPLATKYERAFGELRRIYWWIRWSRFHKDVRRHYRRAQKEKARLVGLGFDQELIRLYCLWMRRPKNEQREKRFYEALERPEQLSLF